MVRASRRAQLLGFTLIELLIVVAIIGILAAIAVPNFLNAQLRAKVARVVSDMKALSKAEEMYHLDHNQYTFDGDCNVGGAEHLTYIPLTTPIAYINSIPRDEFSALDPKFENLQTIKAGIQPVFEYTSRVSFGPNGTPNCKNIQANYDMLGKVGVEYVMISLGPNGTLQFAWSVQHYEQVGNGRGDFVYEPTNGLTSNGDIFVLNSRIVGGG